MFFNTTSISESTVTNWDEITPSKYEANLEGALMLVYENECNYNALMRAAGLSELKYYKETGGDLFLQEAGAFGGFLEKTKEFFKKVLDKIKSMFKKFFMTVNSYIQNDQDFVKKYSNDILFASTNIADMEIKGYTFKGIDSVSKNITDRMSNVLAIEAAEIGRIKKTTDADYNVMNDDNLEDKIKENRGKITSETAGMDESEFRSKLKELLYGGEKDTLKGSDINIKDQLLYIKDAKSNIKNIQDTEKKVSSSYDKIIKELDNKIKEFKNITTDDSDAGIKSKNNAVKALNQQIRLTKAKSNDVTVACGVLCQAFKDRNRQAKAICIKAVSYASKKKNESAVYSDSDDLFAGVTIR